MYSCVASCTFQAIKVEVQRKSITFSESDHPEPVHQQIALPVIKQVADFQNFCRGCGMCEKVCPNNAIRAVRNAYNRKNLFSSRPIKRGGRTNLNAQRTLDKIIVGRISQMTDPSLDSQRHTFDIRSPLGRVLSAKELPFAISDGKLVMRKKNSASSLDLPANFLGYVNRRTFYACLGVSCARGGLFERKMRTSNQNELWLRRNARKIARIGLFKVFYNPNCVRTLRLEQNY